MSHDIIKSIVIKNNQVIIAAASNNVWPRTYTPSHCESLTKILVNNGREALDVAIFKAFRDGNFQGMSTQYAKALVWQKQSNATCPDSDLLHEFKHEWNKKIPFLVFTGDGYPVTQVYKKTLNYDPSKKRMGKEFKNEAKARYALRNFEGLVFEEAP